MVVVVVVVVVVPMFMVMPVPAGIATAQNIDQHEQSDGDNDDITANLDRGCHTDNVTGSRTQQPGQAADNQDRRQCLNEGNTSGQRQPAGQSSAPGQEVGDGFHFAMPRTGGMEYPVQEREEDDADSTGQPNAPLLV